MERNVTREEKNRRPDNYHPLYTRAVQMLLVRFPYEYPIYAENSPIYVRGRKIYHIYLRIYGAYRICIAHYPAIRCLLIHSCPSIIPLLSFL